MIIKRGEVNRNEVDFSDVTSGSRLPPVHPGEILRDEFLRPMELSVYRLARALKISRPRLNDVVRGRRRVTTDTALRLGRYFGTTPGSGSIFRRATISISRSGPCGPGSSAK